MVRSARLQLWVEAFYLFNEFRYFQQNFENTGDGAK
jgi:hypothetical protein